MLRFSLLSIGTYLLCCWWWMSSWTTTSNVVIVVSAFHVLPYKHQHHQHQHHQHHQQQHGVVVQARRFGRVFGGVTVSLAAASFEEDLELTRQIIWEHIRKTEGAYYLPEDQLEDVDDDVDDDDNKILSEVAYNDVDTVVDGIIDGTQSSDASAAAAAAETTPEPSSETTPESSSETSEASEAAATSSSSSLSSPDDSSWLLGITYQRKEAEESYHRPPPPTQNDLMIRAALGQSVEQTPVWLFRQAGRHLPEYEAYKKSTGRNFLELLAYPDSVAECTMQPLRRYDVDAAILFSDILVIPEALGIEVSMPGGVGIQVPYPLQGPDEVATRIPKLEDMTPQFVQDKLGHVLQAVTLIRTKMQQEQRDIPLIGFSAAPWTLLYYMVGGSSKKNTDMGVKWLTEHTDASQQLLRVLTKVVVEYLSAQVEAGAHMIQIFEAMGMMIDEENFYKYALPCLVEIGTELKQRFPDLPIMVFCRGACFSNGEIAKVGCFDVVTMDGSVDRASARNIVGDSVSLQGNYDPIELIEAGGIKTPETVRQTAKQLLHDLGPQRLIANLGEGLGGKESTDLVKAFVDAIHEESAAMIAAAISNEAQVA